MRRKNPLSDGEKLGLAIAGTVAVLGGIAIAVKAASASTQQQGNPVAVQPILIPGSGLPANPQPNVTLQEGAMYALTFWHVPTDNVSIAKDLIASGFALGSVANPSILANNISTQGQQASTASQLVLQRYFANVMWAKPTFSGVFDDSVMVLDGLGRLS